MRIRPGVLYKNLLIFFGCGLFLYILYSIFAYDDRNYHAVHRRQKHLYLTVSKDRIEHRFKKLAPKRILMWTKVFEKSVHYDFNDCKGYSDRCIITLNKSLLSSSDAVVFHASNIADGPLPEGKDRNPRQIFVFLNQEASVNVNHHAVPYLAVNFFNWTATYLLSSDVIFKYGPYLLPTKLAEEKGFKLVNLDVDLTFPKRKSGVFGLISNCGTVSKREIAFAELSRFMNVTIAGKCAPKQENVNICPRGNNCLDDLSEYPFFFAVENTVCTDYITEKYWDRIYVPSIPIVMRRKIYESSMPPHSFIAMDDFDSPKQMAEYLNRIESDKEAYESYFAWRKGGWTLAPWNAPGYRNGFCRLCERLWEDNKTSKTIDDVWAWLDASSQCEGDDFVKGWIQKDLLNKKR